MILHIFFKGLVCPLITKSPAAERFSKDWPRSEASLGNVKFWSSTDFLVASTIALSNFLFCSSHRVTCYQKNYGNPSLL